MEEGKPAELSRQSKNRSLARRTDQIKNELGARNVYGGQYQGTVISSIDGNVSSPDCINEPASDVCLAPDSVDNSFIHTIELSSSDYVTSDSVNISSISQ